MSDITSWTNESLSENPSSWSHENIGRLNNGGNSSLLSLIQKREANKRFRAIYQEHGLNYGEDVPENELPERFRVALNLRKKNIKLILQKIRLARNVELCFMVDSTASMQRHIDGVRDSIIQIVYLLKKANPHSLRDQYTKKLKLSIVAYRDFKDKKHFQLLDFTESVDKFQSFCGKLNADGGGDTPEDIFGAFEEVFKLAWSDDCGTKVIFHIADAPCHGRKYHEYDDADDDYPDGDPKNRCEIDIFNKIADKNIDYYFGKINSSTDIMLGIFSAAYGKKITDFDIKDVLEITSAVFTAVTTSVFFSPKAATIKKEPTYKLDTETPNWKSIPKKNGRFMDYEMPVTIDDIVNDVTLERNLPNRAVIQIADNPFAKGAERYAFYGRDLTIAEPVNIVLKEYIKLNSEKDTATRYEITNQFQTIASFFARKFNEEFGKVNGFRYAIKFLKVKTLCIEMGKGKYRYLSCEKQYGKDHIFVRFTNNADYEMVESTAENLKIDINFVWTLTAFSHWTYQVTNGNMMVVDLQGIITKDYKGKTITVLTDPAIHCVDETRFGTTNLGKVGMDTFFEGHECNKFCQALSLKPVNFEECTTKVSELSTNIKRRILCLPSIESDVEMDFTAELNKPRNLFSMINPWPKPTTKGKNKKCRGNLQ